jgi:membrane protease YdiL (CAAX protease family)
MSPVTSLLDSLRGRQRKATVILLGACWLLLLWKYYCAPAAVQRTLFADWPEADAGMAAAIAHHLTCLLLMGLLPAIVIKLVSRERLIDYGAGPGNVVRTSRTMAIFVPCFLLAGYLGAGNSALREVFPINPRAGESAGMFALHTTTLFAYYVGWEFWFRGVMLFGLRETVGDANAVLIQALASSLLHIGSPATETFGAILGGILWGMLALRTRSIWSGLLQHFSLGWALDWTVCFG